MMKNQKHLLPALKTDFLDPESGELTIQYRNGHPRTYRFDASRGLFSINGESNITKKGQPLTFIPIAFRIFRDDILGFGLKKWVEFFFINASGQLCNLLFHGYSVENLQRKTNDLYYDNLDLTQVKLTASPMERVKQTGEGKGNKYYLAEFSYQPLEKQQIQYVVLIGDALRIWRTDTLTGDAHIELAVNYCPPIQPTNDTEVVNGKTTQDSTPSTKANKATATVATEKSKAA